MERNSSNTHQIFWILLGNFSSFAFAILSSMLLSRYFDKDSYGTYRQVMYIYTTLLGVFSVGLPKAYGYFLPRAKDDEARDIISKLNRILLISGIILFLLLFIGAGVFADLLKNKDLESALRYFSLVPLFMLPTIGLEGILATYKKGIYIAVYNICSKIFMTACVVLPVLLFEGDVLTAIIGFSFSSFICFLLAMYLKKLPVKSFIKHKSNLEYKEIFNYCIPIMSASLWGIVIASSDQFFISRYFGQEVFADFANGSLELPIISMIISSTATVLTPVFSRIVFEKGENAKLEILTLWRSVLGKTVKLIYPIVLFCFLFGDVIMTTLYGDRYITSGVYFQIKLIVNFFTVITYGPLLLTIGGQKFYYNVHAYGALVLIILEWLAIQAFQSPYIVVVVSVVCQIGRILFMINFIANYFKVKLLDLFPGKLVLSIVLPSIIILYSTRYLLETIFQLNNIVLLVLALIVYLVIYTIWVLYSKIDYKSIINPILIRFKK